MTSVPGTTVQHLFLSDAHLGGFSPEVNQTLEQELIQLVEYCERYEIKIHILGDLFDYWMEYPGQHPSLGEQLLERFERYNRQLGPTLFITGNHDNWTRTHLTDRGFDIEPEYRSLSVGSHNTLLLHGDGLSAAGLNLPRPPMHRLLRNPTFIKYYQKLLSPRLGLLTMKYFSRLNRFFGHFRMDEKKLNKWAESQLKHSEFDVILCGHDHIPREKGFSSGQYLNLGTFYKHRTMGIYTNKTFKIVVWNSKLRSLTPLNNISYE